MSPDVILNILTAFFILAPLLQGAVTLFLWKAWRKKESRTGALTERFINSIFRLIGGIALSALAFNRALSLHLANDVAIYLLALSLLTTLLPSFVWLYMYYRNKF